VDTSLAAALGVGFLLGLRHALDADHIAAMSALLSRKRGVLDSCLRGTFWGIGHTSALLAAGAVVMAFKLQISPEFERGVETVVAAVLVLLGADVLRRAFGAVTLHRHPHVHGEGGHSHVHVHLGDVATHRHVHSLREAPPPLLLGLLHGLAGSGALVVLVMATMPSPGAALLYILVFGIGSTVGMLALSGLIGLPFALAGGSRAVGPPLQALVGAASIVIGVLMLLGAPKP